MTLTILLFLLSTGMIPVSQKVSAKEWAYRAKEAMSLVAMCSDYLKEDREVTAKANDTIQELTGELIVARGQIEMLKEENAELKKSKLRAGKVLDPGFYIFDPPVER